MANKTECEETPAQKRLRVICTNREDFMKRWFAIAISVGFATAVSNMPWLREGAIFGRAMPVDWEQIKQIARLAAAAVATIMSWEGYLLSISNKPLGDEKRFYIDVFLVFLYLFLLLTSKFPYFWLWIHAFAFAIYILWDFLSIREHRSAYTIETKSEVKYEPTVAEVYGGCINSDPRIYHGPLVTLVWPIYFATLPMTYQFFLPETVRERASTTIVYAILVLYGLVAYRIDKRNAGRSPLDRLIRVSVSALVVIGIGVILRSVG